MLAVLAAGVALPWESVCSGQSVRRHKLGVCSISYALRWPSIMRGQATAEEFLGFIDHCHELGAGGVQTAISSDPAVNRKIRERVEAKGLYLEGQISLPKTDADLERFSSQVVAAKETGVTVVRAACLAGRRYETFRDAVAFREFATQSEWSLGRAEKIMRQHGIRLAVENHKDWRIDEMVPLLRRLSSEFIGICVDTGNSIALLEDPIAVVEAYAPYAYSTHLKDMAVRECDDGFLLAEVPLGEGCLDLARIVQTLRQVKPDLEFTLEMITRDALRVPCLTRAYWGPLEGVQGAELAATLSFVRARASSRPIPQVSGLTPEQKLELENDAVRKSLAYARNHLGL